MTLSEILMNEEARAMLVFLRPKLFFGSVGCPPSIILFYFVLFAAWLKFCQNKKQQTKSGFA